jgi:uncharacterized phosphosugar-binding protein
VADLLDQYLDTVRDQLEYLRMTQLESIARAAVLLAGGLRRGGVIHLFGTGHSHMLAEEVFYRAGGLVPVNPMLDASVVLSGGARRSTETERRTGAAAEIAARYDLRAEDAGVVISHSGRNPAPVEMAQLMRRIGMPVVAVTSVAHSSAQPPLDPPGVRLVDVASQVIDTCGHYGDAALELLGLPYPVGPTSSVVGTAIMQLLMIAVMQEIAAAGERVINLPSANVSQADLSAVMAELARYRGRIRHL